MAINFVNFNDPEQTARYALQQAQGKLGALKDQIADANFGIAHAKGAMPRAHRYAIGSNGRPGYAGADWAALYEDDPAEAQRRLDALKQQLADAEVEAVKARAVGRATWQK